MITGVMIDSREPAWVQTLKFGGAPTSVIALDYGDLWAACDDGNLLVIERKTPDDFLNTLKDERLFPQLARMSARRLDGQWPYLMITGTFGIGPAGKAVTDQRVTGWDWSSIQGAILTAQEMGVFVTQCAGDMDYEAAVIRLSQRNREPVMKILPARAPATLGADAAILASLPGIGIEKIIPLMEYGGSVAWALQALTEADSKIPGIGPGIKNRIRKALGLEDGNQLAVIGEKSNGNGTH